MKKTYIILYLAIMSIHPSILSAQSSPNPDLEDARKAIAESNEILFQAFVKNDPSLFISRYAEDCWIMPPNAPILCGPDAPGDFFRTAYNKFGVRNGKFITVDVYGVSEDIVAEIGFWQLYDAVNIELDNGKFIVLWKKTSKGWKMWRDSFNSSRSRK
jgi:ketosteroid isomerase-like protein